MTKVMGVCPKCGSHLIIKDGQFGEFLACPRFPDCKYTKRIDGEVKLYQTPSPYCKKCDHTGLLPFIKNNKVIPDAFIDCECKLSLPEHYNPVRLGVEDFDFPCSYQWRQYQTQIYEGIDLSTIDLQQTQNLITEPITYHHRPHQHTYTHKLAGRLFARMDALEVEVKSFKEYLKKKEAERVAQRIVKQKKPIL